MEIAPDEPTYTEDICPDSKLQNSHQVYQKLNQHSLPNDMSKQGFVQQTRVGAASGVSSQQNMFQPQQNNYFTSTPQSVPNPRNFLQNTAPRAYVYGLHSPQTTQSYTSPTMMSPSQVMPYASSGQRIPTPPYSNQPQQPFQMAAAATNQPFYPSTAPNTMYYHPNYQIPRPQQRKRGCSKIRIVDPASGRDISDEIRNTRQASDGSGGGSGGGDMRAQFAAQVAATLKTQSQIASANNFQLQSPQMPGGQVLTSHQATPQIAQPALAVQTQSMPQRPVTPQGQRRQTSKSPPGVLLESTNVMNVANFSANPQKLTDNSCIKYMPPISPQAQDLVPNQPHTPTQLSPPVSPPAQQTVTQAKHPPQIFKNSQPAHSLQIHTPPSQPTPLQASPIQQPHMPEQQPVQPRISPSIKSMPQASKRGLSPTTQVPSHVCQPQTLPHQSPQYLANSLPSQESPQPYLQQKVSHEVIQNSLMAPVSGLQQQPFNSALDLENPEGIIKTESYNEVIYPAISTSGALKKDDSPDRQLDDSSQLVAQPQPLLSKQHVPATEALTPDTNQQEAIHTEAVKPVNIESDDDDVSETKEEPLKKEQSPVLDEEKIEVDTEKTVVSENVADTKEEIDESESASVQPPPEIPAEEISSKDSKKEKTKVNETLNVGKTKEAENDNVDEPENTETEEIKDPVKQSETANVTEEKEEKVAEETKVVINIEDKVVADENEKNEAKNIEDAAEESDESILGYKYKDDQWSPLHPERKKQYDRDFLLKLQFANESVLMPLGLPDLPDIILTKPHEPERNFEKVPGSGSFESVFDFTPKYMRANKTPGNVRNIPKRSSQQGGVRKEVKKITGICLSSEVPLKRCDNAWRPTHKHISKEEEEDDEDDINKKVRSILNKLTPQKFEVLLSQIKEININTENKLKVVIGLLFEKAISEPSFSVAYANLCNCLVKIKVPSSTHQGTVNFRDTLLNRCQVEFEKHSSEEADLIKKQKELEKAESDETKKRLKEELEEAFSAAKRRSIGNIRFIGELFKLNMLTEKIMHDCVSNLLKSRDEESLECLCRLLKTVGKEVDSDISKGTMKTYFQQMKDIVSEKKTSSRVRFMLQDAIELRENNWVPRRAENNPKTIQQIHLEAAQEERERKIHLENAAAKQRIPHHRGVGNGASNTGMSSGPGVRASQGRVPSMGGAGGADEGWTHVRSKLDINKLRLRLPWNRSDTVQLGPGGGNSAGWGRGSSGPKGTQESEKPVNRFYALSRNDDDSRSSIYPRRGASPGRSEIGRSLTSSSSASSSGSRSKISSLPSEEGEKDSGLARNIQNRGSRTSSQVPSRESSQSREKSQKKTVEILNEYFNSNNLEEAKLSIQELSDQQKFVVDAFNVILERSEAKRKQSGKLLSVLLKEKIIEGKRFTQGLMEILETAEDMQIDIPKIWQYFGELISPIIQAGGMPLSFLKIVCEPLKKSNLGGILPSEILKDLCKTMGEDKAAELWQSSKLQWSDFLDEKDIDSFIKEKKLEYTLGKSVSKPTPGSLTMANIQSTLTELISKSVLFKNDITAWIEANVSEQQKKDPLLIRAIMTAVCSSSLSGQNYTLEKEKLSGYYSFLKKYLKNKDDEVLALYALQSLDTKLEHPPSVLKNLFVTLYEAEVISKQAFISWENSSAPAEQEGRGVALKQVSTFLSELEEDDDDEEIDADDS